MSKPNLAYLVLNSGTIILNLNGKSYHINSDNRNYTQIRDAINDHINGTFLSTAQWESLCDVSKFITSYVGNSGVEFRNGEFFYCGQPLHNEFVDKIEQLQTQGFNIDPMVKFLENLMQNSSKRATETVPPFINAKHMTITPDGCFLGYKSVNGDYLDWHSKKYSNKVGTVHEIPRNTVDENAELACSYGFHVGTYSYAYKFHNEEGQHIMLVKVNPKDVVSVPSDATEGKVRVCRYEVIGEMTDKEAPIEEAVTNSDGSKYSYTGPLDNDDDEDQNDDLMDEESDSYDEDDSYYDSYDEDSYEDNHEQDLADILQPMENAEVQVEQTGFPWPVEPFYTEDFVHNGQNYCVGLYGGQYYLYRYTVGSRMYGEYLQKTGKWGTYCVEGWFQTYNHLKCVFESQTATALNTTHKNVTDALYRPSTNENYKKQKRDSNGRFIKG